MKKENLQDTAAGIVIAIVGYILIVMIMLI
jgi:hypothetical protein